MFVCCSSNLIFYHYIRLSSFFESEWDSYRRMEGFKQLCCYCPRFPSVDSRVCLFTKFRYSVSYGMFHFCVLDSELEWRAGSEQHKWLETCLASVDRRTQPWLIVTGHRVLGYSSADEYAAQGTFGEPMAREALESLYQKYKVDIAMFGHVHQYERTCPVYEVPTLWILSRSSLKS